MLVLVLVLIIFLLVLELVTLVLVFSLFLALVFVPVFVSVLLLGFCSIFSPGRLIFFSLMSLIANRISVLSVYYWVPIG